MVGGACLVCGVEAENTNKLIVVSVLGLRVYVTQFKCN